MGVYINGKYVSQIPEGTKGISRLGWGDSITIPSSVTSIEELYNCINLTIPSSVTSIGIMKNCENLTIPSSVTSLQRVAICRITIPSSVTYIAEVDGNKGTSFLKMESATPPVLGKAVFLSSDDTLIVPVGAKEAYAKDPKWGKFKNIREDADLGIASNRELQNKSKDDQKEQSTKNEPTTVKKETIKSGPTQDELLALDRLIDAALEDFVVTDEERKILLNKVKAIGMNQDEFTLILNSKIEKRLKEKPVDKPEEKKKGFFARLFGL